MPNLNERINYIELPAKDLASTKSFFNEVFAFNFTDYGPEYTAFSAESAGLEGGFYLSNNVAATENGSALVVFYSDDLELTKDKIENASGEIVKPIFNFPGGRRFHFKDPSGNEWAVWSDK